MWREPEEPVGMLIDDDTAMEVVEADDGPTATSTGDRSWYDGHRDEEHQWQRQQQAQQPPPQQQRQQEQHTRYRQSLKPARVGLTHRPGDPQTRLTFVPLPNEEATQRRYR